MEPSADRPFFIQYTKVNRQTDGQIKDWMFFEFEDNRNMVAQGMKQSGHYMSVITGQLKRRSVH